MFGVFVEVREEGRKHHACFFVFTRVEAEACVSPSPTPWCEVAHLLPPVDTEHSAPTGTSHLPNLVLGTTRNTTLTFLPEKGKG